MAVHNYIMDRIMEKPDPNPHATCEGRLNVERHKQVKILVPNSTAGMVIGKGGQYIKDIKDQTGAYVQISQKSRDFNLPERCIIVAGDLDQTRAAIQIILNVIAADPQSSSCANVSYHDVRGPVASVYPTGSPYANPVIPCPSGTNWITGTVPLDPTGASSLMTAVLPHAGSVDASRTAALGLYSTSPDLSPVVAFGGTGLAPIPLQQPMPSPVSTNELFGAALSALPFGTSPVQHGFSPVIDPNSAMATALFAASLCPKPEASQLADSSVPGSSLLSQYQTHFRLPTSSLIGYQTSHQPNVSGSHISQANTEASVSTTASPSTASPSVAASMALAALSAAAAFHGSTASTNFLPSASSLFGIMQPSQVPQTAPVRLPHPQMSGTQISPRSTDQMPIPSPSAPHYLFAGMGETVATAGTGGAVAFQQPVLSTSPPVAAQCSPFGMYSAQQPQQQGITASHSLSTSPAGCYPLSKRTIEVPESIIGLILGPEGRSIVNLQATTNTLIQISQKGVYVPGTQNRIVTLTGLQPNIQYAASVIEQLVGVEQLRRVPATSSPATHDISRASVDPEDLLHTGPSVFLYSGLPATTVGVMEVPTDLVAVPRGPLTPLHDGTSTSSSQISVKPNPHDDGNLSRNQSLGS